MPSLSILLPTFNGARFLGEQVRSILKQTFADFELLAIDDGSTDATVEILSSFAIQDKRVRVLLSSGNEGQKRRLRTLADAASADRVAISDQDDVWALDKLDLLMRAENAALSFGDSLLVDAEGHSLGRTLLDGFQPPFSNGDRLVLLFRPTVSAHAMIVQREFLLGEALARSRPFDWLIALEAAFSAGIAWVPAARTFHRLHGQNQMNGGLIRSVSRVGILDPRALARQTAVMGGLRANLLAALEHLGHSRLIPSDTARRFAAAHAACWSAWYDPFGTFWGKPEVLLARLADLLQPLAGNAADWTYAEAELTSICQPAITFGRLKRQVLRRIRLGL